VRIGGNGGGVKEGRGEQNACHIRRLLQAKLVSHAISCV
jgi:hypothetical protein